MQSSHSRLGPVQTVVDHSKPYRNPESKTLLIPDGVNDYVGLHV